VIGERLESLVADLTSSRTDKRNAAVSALFEAIEARQETDALEKLAKMLEPMASGKLSWDRALAIHAIGRVRLEQAVPLLEKHLGDPDSEVRAAVEDIAEDIGEAGKPLLKKLVKDPDFGVRFWAAATLSETGDAEGVEVLIEGMSTSGTRFEALQGLRRLGDRRGEPAARKVLGKWFLAAIDRVAALGLLAAVGDPDAKKKLVEEIGKRRSDGRGLAMQIAGEIKLAEAVPVLEAIFRDREDPHRGSAAMALGEMKLEKFLPELTAMLLNDQETADLRGDVAWALHLNGTEPALAALREAGSKATGEELKKDLQHAIDETEKAGRAAPP
jgi:HEAT repeat protein